jgi:Fe2+ transport system protein FeoA
MKKTLMEVPVGTTITVKRIAGGRKTAVELEEMGILPGSDITMASVNSETETCLVDIDRGQREISFDMAARIIVEPHYVRTNEPVLLCGCCATGDMTAMLERMEKAGKPQS